MTVRRSIRISLAVLIVIAIVFSAIVLQRKPSLTRDWAPDQTVLPVAVIRGPLVEIRNVRDFRYRTSETDFVPAYDTRTYDLRKLDSAWYVVERFGGPPGVAHTFLCFGFGDQYIAISVEIRKKRNEVYSALKGLFREYELMYVIGDERDLIGVRTNIRRDVVYLYPVKTTPEKMRQVFLDMVKRANSLAVKPEFYNTLTNNCTSNIVRHVNDIAPGRIPFSTRLLLPGYSDSLAHEIGLIDTDLPLERSRETHRIDTVAQRYGVGPDFSRVIRRGRLTPKPSV